MGELFACEATSVLLFGDDKKKELVDLATVSDQEVKNDDIIYFCLMKPSGGFEDIAVEELTPFGGDTGEEKS